MLIVEDDRMLGETLKEFLESQGFVVDWLYDPREVIELLEVSSYDVIVLDLMMPHMSGEELLVKIRQKDKRTPVLILTAKARLEDKERCFSQGADDYLTKPFEPRELLLRLRALCRRRAPERFLKVGSVEIDLDAERVSVGGKELRLTKRDWLILKLLAENRGRFVPSEEILNYVWGAQAVGDEVVRAHIKNLRRVLPEGFIQSVKGRGYRIG